ncbi:copper homeostasis protein CutC [Endozoicomonas arenosclerae]|uniref:copper homeostasis protein CutC n=1 Tax=Endozoicomonas arenosclerae TaxID=1633495 RepID=UPI000782E93C|nr:copper homeostasis protein CutC [Endozoicomonas arenosclerae]
MSIPVEICINSLNPDYVYRSVAAAYDGGASRIELCGDMSVGGVTPDLTHLEAAREAFRDRPGLLCMIRPRGGDFAFGSEEVLLMEKQISDAAKAGADGVVIGALQLPGNTINRDVLGRLVDTAKTRNLSVTFHRALDATPNVFESLEVLIQYGVDRILSSGTAWGSADGAFEGVKMLEQLMLRADKKLELVVGGGVVPDNIRKILDQLPVENHPVSVHAYSSVLEGGEVSVERVRSLCQSVEAFQ